VTATPSRRSVLTAGAALGAGLLAAGCTTNRATTRAATAVNLSRTLMIFTTAGRVVALNAATGETAWTRQLTADDAQPAIISAHACYVIGDGDILYALDPASGATRWQFHGTGQLDGPAVSDTGVFLFESPSSDALNVSALDPATGRERWAREVNKFADVLVTAGGSVAAGTNGASGRGTFTAFDATSGDVRYSSTDAGFISMPAFPVFTVDGSFLIGGTTSTHLLNPADWQLTTYPTAELALGFTPEELYIETPAGAVQAIGMAAGLPRWTLPLPPYTFAFQALSSGDHVFVIGTFTVTAVDSASGHVVWTLRFDQARNNIGFTAMNEESLFLLVNNIPQSSGRVIAVDGATGKQRWAVDITGEPFAPVLAAGTLFFSTGAQLVYALDAASGRTRWIEPTPGQPSNIAITTQR
jgi:outer membrane protein assembly factor BamB